MNNIFRDNPPAGKVAFVTGRASGINLRIAERCAEYGAKPKAISVSGRVLT